MEWWRQPKQPTHDKKGRVMPNNYGPGNPRTIVAIWSIGPRQYALWSNGELIYRAELNVNWKTRRVYPMSVKILKGIDDALRSKGFSRDYLLAIPELKKLI